MKKIDSSRSLKLPLAEQRPSYYREVGEKAALYTFTKNNLRHKLQSLSPQLKLSLSKDELQRTEKELNNLLLSTFSPELSIKREKIKSPQQRLQEISKATRDVSHIRDANAKGSNKTQDLTFCKVNELPLDINVVKKVIENSDFVGVPFKDGEPVTFSCRKEACLQSVFINGLADFADSDKLYLGSPSGRQESENLKKWIQYMLETYCSDYDSNEKANMIYTMASREIIRQVSVHCYERGSVLQDILKFFIVSYKNAKANMETIQTQTTKIKKIVFEDFKSKEIVYLSKIQNLEETVEFLNSRIQEKIKKIAELNEKIIEDNDLIEELKIKFSFEAENSFRGFQILHKGKHKKLSPARTARGSKVNFFKSEAEDQWIQTDPIIETDPRISSRITQTDPPNLSLYRDGFGIEVLTEAYMILCGMKPAPPVSNQPDFLEQGPKDHPKKLLEPESRESPKKKPKRSTTARFNTIKNLKAKLTLHIEHEKKIVEKDKEIEFLMNKLNEYKIELDRLKFDPDSRRESLLPTITINQLMPEIDSQNFDLISFQNGYKSGFDNGYTLGINTMSQSEGPESLSVSNPEFWDEPDSPLKEPKNKENSPDKLTELELPKELIRSNTLNTNTLTLENFVRSYSNITDSDDDRLSVISEDEFLVNESLLKKRGRSIRKSLTHGNLGDNIGNLRNQALSLMEIVEFNFHQKNFKELRKNSPDKILALLLTKKKTWIKRKASMSKKMINKLMSAFYISYYAKADYTEPLLYYVYDEFVQKSGLKKAGDKKFIQFISSLIVSSDSRRSKNFLKFIGTGKAIKEANFSMFSLKFYLECMHFMYNAKIGISYVDDTLDKIMLPLSRAVECIKDKLEKIDRTLIGKTISAIENRSEQDPKKINQSGVVECELLLETLVKIYETFQKTIFSGIESLINAIKTGEDRSLLTKAEALMLFRFFSPAKVEDFDITHNEVILIEDFCQYCISNSLLSSTDIESVVPHPPNTSAEMNPLIQQIVHEAYSYFQQIKPAEKFEKSLPMNLWEKKLIILAKNLQQRDFYECLLAAEIYKTELHRLVSM